ncbi:aromatic ring-hydroxylating oxygenase subunit alpha [Gordonibacter massiliensis (ex Traore et al. 2017)]|uniref:aromatic ring-hydroxylating oxygenase subunit alpha n=1 Tax=Gordonibacter massiliensis (ex Traore et al. 2017) TaxID=1841863 RepID=UPI001C8BCB92|nr:aromatic ring-hydroxylating dioxygenase subunit alpha [Gordonibacter massiliensis (ex Traore et al. 2017)]MBX9034232.1 aromatic ring-hydroxylating dioxygenase subunit alpha [Gordonibacter massiliensis (ex Traore et al. 2017)]
MIPDQWYAVMASSEVKSGRPVGVVRFGRRLVLWRDAEGNVACLDGTCCHRGADLAAGRVEGDHVQCPFHGLRYAADGRVVAIPANGLGAEVPENFRVRPWLAVDAFGFIWVFYGKPADAPDDLPMFQELRHGFPYAERSEVWDVHYSRAIENQLDVIHLPFVHPNTIGRGHKTVVNGPVTKWDADTLTFYVKNEPDRGQTPQAAGEIEDWEQLNSLQYRVPNLWQNRISDDLRVFAAFAPIDDEHVKIYLRLYQRIVRVPVLRGLVCALGNVANGVILHQDRRVVLTQRPKKTELQMGENLLRGDRPVIEFRSRRDELKRAAEGR